MLSWAVVFLIIAIIAAVLGFSGIAGTASWIAKVLFVVFIILFLINILFGGTRAPAEEISGIYHLHDYSKMFS